MRTIDHERLRARAEGETDAKASAIADDPSVRPRERAPPDVVGAVREVALAAMVVGVLTLWLDARAAEIGEPALVRWLRIVVEHPYRSTLALWLAWHALRARAARTDAAAS